MRGGRSKQHVGCQELCGVQNESYIDLPSHARTVLSHLGTSKDMAYLLSSVSSAALPGPQGLYTITFANTLRRGRCLETSPSKWQNN
jgi:hypothetical protein